jgi:uncharacterized protein YprB with RNaseH-like and TPR domain
MSDPAPPTPTPSPSPGDYWARRVQQAPTEPPPALQAPVEEGVPDRARRLLRELTARHRGRHLEDIYQVTSTQTSEGSCTTLVDTRPAADAAMPARMSAAEARARLMGALELVWGVGPWHAERCRRDGFMTVEDLVRHPRFGALAAEVRDALNGDPTNCFRCVRDRAGASDPLLWCTRALFNPEDLLFYDIETLGFFGVAVILVGTAEWRGGSLAITQYLARSVAEEPALLAALDEHAAGKRAVVTFNGHTFDAPVLLSRAAYYGIPWRLHELPHYDLLHFARRAWRERLPDFHAVTIERDLLGIVRPDDLPGAYVPAFYEAYREDGEIGPLTYIVDHNRRDLEGMARIFGRLAEEWEPRHVG